MLFPVAAMYDETQHVVAACEIIMVFRVVVLRVFHRMCFVYT